MFSSILLEDPDITSRNGVAQFEIDIDKFLALKCEDFISESMIN